MIWQTVRNAGYISLEDNLEDGIGIRNTRRFLQDLAKEFVSLCVKHHSFTGELPFIYRERQINSILLPAIAKISDAVFTEQPVRRKSNQKHNHGWLDYWVLYGNTTFLIELKHSWCSVTSKQVRKNTLDTWSAAIRQIRSITKEHAKGLAIYKNNIIKIAIIIIPFYRASANQQSLVPIEKESIIEKHNALITALNPNWSCIWSLHKNLQKSYEYDDVYELYSGVGIVTKIIPLA